MKHEEAYQDYCAGMKYKEIAEKYKGSINTVKSWKTRYKWSRKGMHTKSKSGTQNDNACIEARVRKKIVESIG